MAKPKKPEERAEVVPNNPSANQAASKALKESNAEKIAAAAEKVAELAKGFAPGIGSIVPYTEPNSGKVMPAIVTEFRLRPAPGWKPGENAVEVLLLVLSTSTSRPYNATITL